MTYREYENAFANLFSSFNELAAANEMFIIWLTTPG